MEVDGRREEPSKERIMSRQRKEYLSGSNCQPLANQFDFLTKMVNHECVTTTALSSVGQTLGL